MLLTVAFRRTGLLGDLPEGRSSRAFCAVLGCGVNQQLLQRSEVTYFGVSSNGSVQYIPRSCTNVRGTWSLLRL